MWSGTGRAGSMFEVDVLAETRRFEELEDER
jgi:hypothetical protein